MQDADFMKIEDSIKIEEFADEPSEEFASIFQNTDKKEDQTICNDESSQPAVSAQNTTMDKKKRPKISTCVSKSLAVHFITNGISTKSYQDAVTKYSQDKVDYYMETVNRILKEAPEYVHQECDSYCFSNISNWLEVLKQRKSPENCYYEPGFIMNVIANSETQPKPQDFGGVNMKDIYTFLSNALLGLPQKPLDPLSSEFLDAEFKSLIDDVNSDYADSQAMTMKEKLEILLPEKAAAKPTSMDPLFLFEDVIVNHV